MAGLLMLLSLSVIIELMHNVGGMLIYLMAVVWLCIPLGLGIALEKFLEDRRWYRRMRHVARILMIGFIVHVLACATGSRTASRAWPGPCTASTRAARPTQRRCRQWRNGCATESPEPSGARGIDRVAPVRPQRGERQAAFRNSLTAVATKRSSAGFCHGLPARWPQTEGIGSKRALGMRATSILLSST